MKKFALLVAATSLLTVGLTTQGQLAEASSYKTLTRNAYVYSAKGKKLKARKLLKGKRIKILSTKKIAGKKSIVLAMESMSRQLTSISLSL
ncbi:hypothetical protein FC52_GL001768 [Lactobacillus pasteurii DSM 23907 = CRBIP 24.76]|uniref:S-layer protein C-terminal domain-containing protein n=1 Tax=Lactobacillus pasteurii DSM 23907 = CRBIP 24.76 TaxID=1423790 RepID=I7LAL3_9LACO|nr:SLAP domain-containing protein [Lactobacillus pasteurii]KRK07495.1 hypothetical protein FC52_GL001768 [Lactobacillus pasteurii DSM 23907 = CRBIP 24.76]TDG77057.1 hypothetical protein C5L33_000700 [Lactobacillus pasteurii]CCI84801.1 Protein of unknown function [Lactobacillus pasteurii DSM 23907 = CRBIP 24.76]